MFTNTSPMLAYTNARIFTGTELLDGFAVTTVDGKVDSIVRIADLPAGISMIDLGGHFLAPAFIDIQIYGGNGKLFSEDLTPAAIAACYDYCRAGGAVQFYITLATNSLEVFMKGIDAVRAYWEQGGRGLGGLHLEGPYLNPAKKGAHLEQFIKKPTVQEVKQLLHYGKGIIKIITIAPEQCDDAVIQLLLDSGILVSAGHSDATYAQAMHAFDRGIPAATHLYNAMSSLQHRAPGVVGAVFNHPTVRSSIVPDGIHVDFAAVKIAKKIMGERLFFITDAVTPTASGAYPHVFKGDRYTMPDGTLSGSALTMMKGVENLVTKAGIEMGEALRMASLYPAQVTRTDSTYGKIAKGYAASFVVFNDEFEVVETIFE